MDSNLAKRLEILKHAGEIDVKIHDSVQYFLGILEQKYDIQLTAHNGAALVTHLAMALARIDKGKDVQGMSSQLMSEVEKSKYYNDLTPLIVELERHSGLVIPDSEQGYLALHLASLLENIKGGENE
ncbi:MAG: PRD domain-containing protein [Firmicutes bacterium]|nr:PRD domain-containing protein [Bacillota bacterium]